MDTFHLVSPYQPTGDQPAAIKQLADGVLRGDRAQTLLGVTGSGKTFTMANIIAKVNRPTLVLAHNKTLAAQLCSEFKEFFPDNAVEYFVSYYDYYQPEAYVPSTDTYIEKDSAINDEIDKLRHSATSALSERRDVVIVASVSCIYNLGDPIDYRNMVISLRPGMQRDRDEVLKKLVSLQYERNDVNFVRNKFRVRGDVVEVFPAYSGENAVRIEFFGDEVERITEISTVTGEVKGMLGHVAIYPASHYIVPEEKMLPALDDLEQEMVERVKWFRAHDKLLEAQRIEQRTKYDIEMLREIGFCSGIENYSRVLLRRPPGATPFTLLDYFPDDYLLFVDESHVTLPQVRGMSAGDRARKQTLVDYGFRLPSALDNRPLNFEEFLRHVNQAVFVSATPGDFEREESAQIVEQVIRPTGLVDPEVQVRPTDGQIDDLLSEINLRVERHERVLVTTLTKKMAEDLTRYFDGMGVKVRYMHHDIEAIERMQIIRDLRLGGFDVLVGINLLREGLDIPEVSLVAILDADKEGFLRSETSLVQTIGRAARNANGLVILYADTVTPSMERAISETERRRAIQTQYNEAHGITPKTIVKDVRDIIEISSKDDTQDRKSFKKLPKPERDKIIRKLSVEMKEAARMLEFEQAAFLRDKIKELRGEGTGVEEKPKKPARPRRR
ncbi:excinuclease ABC subunit UvrB [Ethanoligenens harbinense]|uniref:UvrABC system protein B n=1 Tax=Ethanoligenens harbinense (strain DSM 18485 / JCM 12961 / CGMCC 1.5033 / YUAN-3) TaxID=663278 RepID=E6U842_ETHHY|nr:excinuclease ABC subunit UvrB [Ethanoligenens harbinense]ADU27061.1 excinuclease ABC, B subunit [Ethanoligenens harbinense YUAN-3]AVQ96141.1 excinuclease ABC subunit UvrB [Ethanoligenens harbinense YUAN-3]AYF38801.1 excinuclease ABC subunit UvrB [Ethanoligenens harbinense]AYF41551.1 excinuclease ABC subunit UvrB [Ethanoligenens harbinense]QCN92382.1 excinuclease ABC subunit UvrB [Ethanoligenens harbinense]